MSRWERVSSLFERALTLPPAERDAFLRRECAGDEALQAEVESLLTASASAGTFFDDLQENVVGPTVGRVLGGADPVAPGTVIGHYEIESRIAGGGMGVVYRARDRRLGRSVALKFLSPELTEDPAARDRLLREARAAAALDDPRIVAIHAIEEAPDGRLFLVMPFYAGETLKERLSRGRLSTEEAVALAIELSDGLARAHRAGIVHRDIKPANVLVTAEGAVKILDFGLARSGAGSSATPTGAMIGTAAYMAPEQARGESVDSRADVWALGVVLYEMLAGERPFRGDSDPALLYAVLEGSPPPLAERAPAVPAQLTRLVERMLSKDPDCRPAEADGVSQELRRIAADDSWERPSAPQLAGPAKGMRRTRRPRRSAELGHGERLLSRHGPMYLVVAAVVLVAAVWTWVGQRLDTAPMTDFETVAVLPFLVRGDPDLDFLRDGIVHLLSTKLDGIGDIRAVDPHALIASVVSMAGGGEAPDPAMGRSIAAKFGAQAFILGTILRFGSGIELTASLYGSGGELKTTASAMAKQDADLPAAVDGLARELVAHRYSEDMGRLGGLAAMTTQSLPALRAYLEGEHLLRTGRPTAALAALQTSVALDSTFGLAWYRLARAAGWIGPTDLNEDAAERAVRFGGVLPHRARSLVAAYRVFRVGDPLEAERLIRQLLASYADDTETLTLLAETLFHNNPFFGRATAEARELFEHALEMDPGNRELLVHLMDLAAARGDLRSADSLVAKYVSTRPGEELPTALHAYAALPAFMRGGTEREVALDRLVTAGPEALFDALVRIAPQLRDPELTDALAVRLSRPAHARDIRATGHLHRAWVAAARGRWSTAALQWEQAESLHPEWTLVHRVLAAAVPHSPVSPTELDDLRRMVVRWEPAPTFEDGLHEGDLDVVRSYLLGLISWRMADDEELGHAIRRLESSPETRTPRLASAFAATLRALDHWRADRLTQAVAELEVAELRLPFHRRSRSPLLEQHLNRYVRAEALRSLGERGPGEVDDEALRWYASLEDGYFHWGAAFVGPALLAAAEIHERRGRPEQAIATYERFITLWEDADPALHAWVRLAREGLARVRTSTK